MKTIEKIFNVQTGEETIIERDMTVEEISFRETETTRIITEEEAQVAEEAAKQQAFNDAVAAAVAAALAAQQTPATTAEPVVEEVTVEE